MPSFGKTSTKRLKTCHPLIQLIMNRVIKTYDCTIICGHREEDKQNQAYEDGNSQLQWDDSKHNKKPSLAIDTAPWPLDWNDIGEFKHLAGRISQAADDLGIKLIWGGNWKRFKDYPHYELDKSMLD